MAVILLQSLLVIVSCNHLYVMHNSYTSVLDIGGRKSPLVLTESEHSVEITR